MPSVTFLSIYSLMCLTAVNILTMANGVVSMNFFTLPSIQPLLRESWGRGINWRTCRVYGREQTSERTLMVLVSLLAHEEMSLSFMCGHLNVNSSPGALPIRYRVHSVILYLAQGSV
jgi:hypothetical protein